MGDRKTPNGDDHKDHAASPHSGRYPINEWMGQEGSSRKRPRLGSLHGIQQNMEFSPFIVDGDEVMEKPGIEDRVPRYNNSKSRRFQKRYNARIYKNYTKKSNNRYNLLGRRRRIQENF